jgi:hypothetical protein
VPQEVPEHPVPETLHVTAVLELPVTLAVNCCCVPFTSATLVGVMVTATGAALPTLTVAVPN